MVGQVATLYPLNRPQMKIQIPMLLVALLLAGCSGTSLTGPEGDAVDAWLKTALKNGEYEVLEWEPNVDARFFQLRKLSQIDVFIKSCTREVANIRVSLENDRAALERAEKGADGRDDASSDHDSLKQRVENQDRIIAGVEKAVDKAKALQARLQEQWNTAPQKICRIRYHAAIPGEGPGFREALLEIKDGKAAPLNMTVELPFTDLPAGFSLPDPGIGPG